MTTRQITVNGLRLTVDEEGEGDRVALCLHGFPESRYSWRYQLPMLAKAGWHAIAPDMRGYGDSDRPLEQSAYAMDRLVEDAGALFDAFGARQRLLIAHDWGALIAWTFALRKTRALDGLVIMNVPHPAVFRDVWQRSWDQKAKSWYVAFFQIPWLPERMLTANNARAVGEMFRGMAVNKAAFPDDVLDHYRQNALKPGAMTAMINYYRANLRVLADRSTPAPMIETPTLMIWGEADAALSIENTRGYEKLVRDFTLERLPRVSHWVQQEAPDEVNARLSTWLAAKGLAAT
ncbi:MAG TPA: alpha/beta hydrolase [Rhizomicrobium sp.]|nr:alpha/beta hydrolase [Rhizomicrobium sp.]